MSGNNSKYLNIIFFINWQSLLVVVALAAAVIAEEKHDQESAEQYYRTYGYYPSWYNYGAVRAYPAAYTGAYAAGYPYAAYPGIIYHSS